MPKEKDNMSKVSVIIPNFNNSRYIEEAVQSVLNQTLQDIEVIVIDDCSTDDSWEILQRLAQIDDRIKIIRNFKKSGAGISRNHGLDIAKGEFIKFLDSDDTMDLDVLECMYNAAKENDSPIVCGYMQRVNKDGSIRYDSDFFYKCSSMLDKKKITPQMPGAESCFNIVAIGDALYSRQLFDNVRFPNLKWEDVATIPLLKYGLGEMFYIDKAVYNYRRHEESTTWSDQNRKSPRVHDIVKCCDILRQKMPKQYQDKVDSMEFFLVGRRIIDICSWKDCSEEQKRKIISALYQIVKKDIPEYYKNKYICNFPLAQEMNQIQEQSTNESVSNLIENIKQFDMEPINLSNLYRSNYNQINRAYKHFIENMDLLYKFPNDAYLNINIDGKNTIISRETIEDHLIQDLHEFYDEIRNSNDYNDTQKEKILKDMYKVTFQLVPNAMEHLLVPNYLKLHSYLLPEFENFSKEQCMEAIDDVVHSTEFQEYSMERMAANSLKKTPLNLFRSISNFIEKIKGKLRGDN